MVQGSEHQGNYMQWTASKMVSALQMPQYLKMKHRVDLEIQKDSSRDEIKLNLQLKEAEALIAKDQLERMSKQQRNLMLKHSKDETKKKKLEDWLQQHEALEYKDLSQDANLNSDQASERNKAPKLDSSDQSLSRAPIEGEAGNHETTFTSEEYKHEHEDEYSGSEEDDEDESLLSSDEDDQGQAILKELQKLREEKERDAQMEKEMDEALALQKAMASNPLLSHSTSTSLKRKWTDDSVFRNQANREESQNKRPRFVNDTLRNDSHKKFMYSIMQ